MDVIYDAPRKSLPRLREYLRHIQRVKVLTDSQFCGAVGISVSYWYRLRTDDRLNTINHATLAKVESVFGKSYEDWERDNG
jgi:hypothetical protein